jgi:hypothetical protein
MSSFGSPSPSNPGAFVVALGRSSSIAPLWMSWSRDAPAVRRTAAESALLPAAVII